MIKSRKVVQPLSGGPEGILYGFYDEDTGEPKIVLALSTSDVESFGFPDRLTVTIETGDLLN